MIKKPHRIAVAPLVIALIFACAAGVSAQFKIDIDSTNGGPLSTEPGWTSLNAGSGSGSVTVGGVVFKPFSADGSGIRTSGGTPTPNRLTADYVFDDGGGAAVGLLFGGAGDLPAGTWQVKVWIWDAVTPVGNVTVGYRTSGSETIVSNNVTPDPENPAITFIFESNGSSAYDFFVRENSSTNRSLFNAVQLSAPDGPTDITLTGDTVSTSAPVGLTVGTLSSTDPTPGDTFTYSLVSGIGSGDNVRFSINGDSLVLDSDISSLSGGDSLSVNIRSTDAEGASFEKVFIISIVNDSDNDGLDDDWELTYFANVTVATGTGNQDADALNNLQEQAAGTNPTLADTDADGLQDHVENGSGIFNSPSDPGSDPTLADTDFDGIGDLEEISLTHGYMTDPNRQDTDGDGYPDPLEITEGTDPTDANSHPSFTLALRLNEILANNANGITDGLGKQEDWIEIYNPNNTAINLDGYYLTDDSTNLTKWNFPNVSIGAQDYLLVFASGKDLADDGSGSPHTIFSLSAKGDYLALVQADGTTIDSELSPTYPKQFADVSYGIHPTNSTLRYFDTRTPAAANNSGHDGVVRDTAFSIDRGFYDAPISVAITSATPGATIRYTTDGTAPTELSGTTYTGPVSVTTTTTLRAIAYRAGWLPTDVDTHTYIFIDDVAQQPASLPGYPDTWGTLSAHNIPADYEMDQRVVNNTLPGYSIRDALLDIPTMSIVMAPGDFLGSPTSIYDHPTTRGAAYEKVCSLEYILPDGTPGFQEDCQIEMHGNSSRNPGRMQKHSFRVTFKADLGAGKLNYPLFSTTNVDRFNKIVLRACFTDSWALASWDNHRYRPNDSQYIRDVWMKRSMGDMGHVTSHGDFVHLYINGIYWGLHNPAERIEDDFLVEHLGGEKEDWEVNEDFRSEDTRYRAMKNINGSTVAGYAEIQDYLDLENFADYMLLHFYGDAEDWPDHNGYAAANINPANGDQKFRFYVWDQEIALDKFTWNRYNATGDPGNVFQDLRQRPEFRLLFADRVNKHLFNGGALSLESSRARYLELANRIDKAIVAESARWGDVQANTPYGSTAGSSTDIDHDNYPPTLNDPIYFTREQHWIVERDNVLNHHLAVIHDESDSRSLISELRAENLYPSIDAPVFSQHGGFISDGFELSITGSNTIWYTTDGSDPRLPNGNSNTTAQIFAPASPIILTGSRTIKSRSRSSGGEWSALTEAFFISGDLVISEIMYNPAGNSDAEFIELLNTGDQPIPLDGIAFTGGISFAFGAETIAPGQRIILARDAAVFQATYGATPVVSGIYSGGLSNSGETIRLEAVGQVIREFTYDDDAPWPEDADGRGRSLVLIAPETDPDHSIASNWRHSAAPAGTPGSSDYNPFTGDPLADTDNNGQADILDYALGTDFSITPPLPPVGIRFTIPQIIGTDDVQLAIEISSDLETWFPLNNSPVVSHTATENQSYTSFEITPPAGIETHRVFLRVSVSSQ